MDPRESGLKSNVKKARKCGNCGVIGHTKLQCAEPEHDIEKNCTISINNMTQLFK